MLAGSATRGAWKLGTTALAAIHQLFIGLALISLAIVRWAEIADLFGPPPKHG